MIYLIFFLTGFAWWIYRSRQNSRAVPAPVRPAALPTFKTEVELPPRFAPVLKLITNPAPAPVEVVVPPAPAAPEVPAGPAPELVPNPWAPLEDKADPSIPVATLEIYNFINATIGRRDEANIERASQAIMCVKRRWYQGKGIEGEQLAPRKIVNFLLGDLTERVLLYFIAKACVGPGKLYSEVDLGREIGLLHFQGKEIKIYEQEESFVEIDGVKVTCHADGWGKRNSDGQWELIECKSASNWGFNDFRKKGPEEYLKQGHVNLQSEKGRRLGARAVRFFYMRKETGHPWDRVFPFDSALWNEIIIDYRTARAKTEPARPHSLVPETYRKKPTGRMIADFPCTYCPYLQRCQGKFFMDWKKDQYGHYKPVFVFEEVKKK